ncbi:hypothetical protein [Frondihabitans sp. PAMC 28766]|uniref:hypothetical protein n=1 Tax=Frondihabitans sp. PAMC 28766 TaxID=1795630 RepID=UPI0012FF9775|nr:hypothetical protein [Frondihabitans sp. PAMC 28766]
MGIKASDSGRLSDKHRSELSRKLRLLMDVVEANTGEPPSFKEIEAELHGKGIALTRPRWWYMLNGTGPVVRDKDLLTGLADFFGVPAEYLTDPVGHTDVPERVQAQLELVLEMRKQEVVAFASRRFDEFATVEEIRDVLDSLRKLEERKVTEEGDK